MIIIPALFVIIFNWSMNLWCSSIVSSECCIMLTSADCDQEQLQSDEAVTRDNTKQVKQSHLLHPVTDCWYRITPLSSTQNISEAITRLKLYLIEIASLIWSWGKTEWSYIQSINQVYHEIFQILCLCSVFICLSCKNVWKQQCQWWDKTNQPCCSVDSVSDCSCLSYFTSWTR